VASSRRGSCAEQRAERFAARGRGKRRRSERERGEGRGERGKQGEKARGEPR